MNIAVNETKENASEPWFFELQELPREGVHSGDQIAIRLVLVYQEGLGFVPKSKIAKPEAMIAEAKTDEAPATDSTENPIWLQRLQLFVEEHLDDYNPGVGSLCRGAHMSHTQLYRKLKAASVMTPSQYISYIRLEKGRVFLEQTDWNINEIAYAVGFNDPNYFS
ncbi:MAG: AraC family transcriptional regulator [Bacteroidota bacterium]